MARVNIFVPGIAKHKFSGGLLTVFEYANGLADLGHEVTVIPINPSFAPEWFTPKFRVWGVGSRWQNLRIPEFINAIRRGDQRKLFKEALLLLSRRGPYSYQRALNIELVRDSIPFADVSIATSYETALINHLFGTGRRYYFAQHFEALFAKEKELPSYAELEARHSYTLPLNIIANSTWLARTIKEEFNRDVPVCLNAIDHGTFFPDGNAPDLNQKFVVLSYGGRNAEWKGFAEAAKAVSMAKAAIPNMEWQVYGDALLPPANPIASYVPLGFITGGHLRRAYSQAHVVLCPSWYESFPLYPLEGMACGAAVVTTPYGTEDYAHHMENAYVVPPRDPEAMAQAMISLYEQEALRKRLAVRASQDAKLYTWKQSITTMAQLLGLG